MPNPASLSPTIRVVPGEVEAGSATTRVVLPTATLPRWLPFVRVAESIAGRRRPFPAHSHERQEVLSWLLEGFATYQVGTDTPEALGAGEARLLTAGGKVAHRIAPAKGSPIRWFTLVLDLPSTGPAEAPVLQRVVVVPTLPEAREVVVQPLVGAGSGIRSAAGLDCLSLSSPGGGAVFSRVGHGRRGILYLLAGRGTVDGRAVEAGEAALIEGAAGIGIHCGPGFRGVMATATAPP